MRSLLALFILMFALLTGAVPAVADKRVALLIGNGTYSAVPALANPRNDVMLLKSALETAGFDDVRVALDLGQKSMLKALNSFADAAADADIAVLYYSGHGLEMGGVNYLVPVDATLATDTDVPDETVTLERAMQALDGAKRLKLVILDACRTNPFLAAIKIRGGRKAIEKGLAPVDPPGSDTLVAFAAKAGTPAFDGDGGNSPFAVALADRLFAPGDDVEIALRKVRDDVLTATHNRQEPFKYGSLGGAIIPLSKAAPKPQLNSGADDRHGAKEPETAGQTDCNMLVDDQADKVAVLAKNVDAGVEACARAVLDHPAETRLMRLLQVAQEQRALQRALRSNVSALSEAYLVLYPSGRFTEDVKQHLASLGDVPAPSSASPGPIQTPKPKIDPADIARVLQVELKRVGCDPISVDGNWGVSSEKAMEQFDTLTHSSFDTKFASLEAIAAVRARLGIVCPVHCPSGERNLQGRCTAIYCAADKVLTQKGSCVLHPKRKVIAASRKIDRDIPQEYQEWCVTLHHAFFYDYLGDKHICSN